MTFKMQFTRKPYFSRVVWVSVGARGDDITAHCLWKVDPAGQVCKSRREKVREGDCRGAATARTTGASARATNSREQVPFWPFSISLRSKCAEGELGLCLASRKKVDFVSGVLFNSHKMNKDLKSLSQLAVPLLLFALCVAVQRSESAVSAF